jgi:hypothetical protein
LKFISEARPAENVSFSMSTIWICASWMICPSDSLARIELVAPVPIFVFLVILAVRRNTSIWKRTGFYGNLRRA